MNTDGKRLLVLGATGPTGRLVVQQALDQGFVVTAVARHPARLGVTHARLRSIQCDVTVDVKTLVEAVEGQDVVISALGRGTSLRSDHLIERSMVNLVPTLERHGPKRVVILSGLGVGDTFGSVPLILRLLFSTLLANIYADKAAGESLVRASGLDWTIVYAAYLTNKPAAGKYTMGEQLPRAGITTVTRADTATALLACAADPSTIRKGLELRS